MLIEAQTCNIDKKYSAFLSLSMLMDDGGPRGHKINLMGREVIYRTEKKKEHTSATQNFVFF